MQQFHMKTPGIFYTANYQFTAAKRKTLSLRWEMQFFFPNLCPIMLHSVGQHMCVCTCKTCRLFGGGGGKSTGDIIKSSKQSVKIVGELLRREEKQGL